jgi:hypothetical protein
MTKRLAFAFQTNLAILVIGAQTPTDEEHRECQTAMAKQDLDKIRSLVLDAGGGLTAAQRKASADLMKGRVHVSAVVSDSPFVRGIVTALSWFGHKVSAFHPDKLDDALAYLSVPSYDRQRVRDTVLRLQKDVGSNIVKPGR